VGSMLDKQGDLSDLNTIPDFLSLQRFSCEAGFKSFDAYSTSKLAGTLLHLELANRLKADAASAGLAINVASPGMVNTELNRHLLPWPVRA
jgi:NAD(P)-dependent dehydrogenase (short-subunit alcohol dehydrogenase family)